MSKVLVTITGPSASGKTETAKAITEEYQFEKVITSTTRPQRPGEVEGKDYYFLTEGDFNDFEATSGLVEHVALNGKQYGVTCEELERVLSSENTPIVIVDPSGVEAYKELEKQYDFKVYSVYIDAPYDVLRRRFLGRSTRGDDTEELTDYEKTRLAAIREEHEEWYNAKPWTLVFHNYTDDIKNLSWFVRLLAKDVSRFREEVNKYNDC